MTQAYRNETGFNNCGGGTASPSDSAAERERILDCAERLLGLELDFYLFTTDHPWLPHCVRGLRCASCAGMPEKRGKCPAVHWPTRATAHPDALWLQFSAGLRNLALACRSSRLVGIDEDVPGALSQYADEIGATVPETFTVTTGRGVHFYFDAPAEPLGNARGQLKDRGIDVRGVQGDGGYVIAPGSRHWSGAVYDVADWGAEIAPLPVWLEEAIRTPAVEFSAFAGLRAGAHQGSYGGDLWRLVLTVLKRAAQGEKRHPVLHWACCRAAEDIAAGYYTPEQAWNALSIAGIEVGLDESDAYSYTRRALLWARDRVGVAA